MRVVIAGAGSVGRSIAQELLYNNHQVLLIDNDGDLKIGKPTVAGATVEAVVVTHDRAKKVIIFKKKRTTTYQRTQGHRQNYTEVRIKAIKA